MASTDCEYVVRLFGVCLGARMMLVSELVTYGSLCDHLNMYQFNLTAKTLLMFASQIASVSFIIAIQLATYSIDTICSQSTLQYDPYLISTSGELN